MRYTTDMHPLQRQWVQPKRELPKVLVTRRIAETTAVQAFATSAVHNSAVQQRNE